MRLKVTSWNIWWGKYLDKVISQIKEINPDVIGLQEVKAFRDGRANLAQDIAQALGYEVAYCKSFADDRHDGIYDIGNAILSKYPIIGAECINLSSMELYKGDSITEPRVAGMVTIVVNNKKIRLINTHLGFSREKELTPIRKTQLANLLEQITGERLILMGDLNSVPESILVRSLNAVLVNTDTDLSKKTKTDFDSPEKKQFRIDYIYTSPDLKTENFEIQETEASDHKPIIALIEV